MAPFCACAASVPSLANTVREGTTAINRCQIRCQVRALLPRTLCSSFLPPPVKRKEPPRHHPRRHRDGAEQIEIIHGLLLPAAAARRSPYAHPYLTILVKIPQAG